MSVDLDFLSVEIFGHRRVRGFDKKSLKGPMCTTRKWIYGHEMELKMYVFGYKNSPKIKKNNYSCVFIHL